MDNFEELFYRYNPWWEGDYNLKDIYDRQNITKILLEKLSSKDVIFLTGLRRVGKTTIFKLVIKKLLEDKNISPNRIFYISLDDYLLLKNNIIEIIEKYRKIHKISFSDKIFVFLD